jgi:hypothetical protein
MSGGTTNTGWLATACTGWTATSTPIILAGTATTGFAGTTYTVWAGSTTTLWPIVGSKDLVGSGRGMHLPCEGGTAFTWWDDIALIGWGGLSPLGILGLYSARGSVLQPTVCEECTHL